MISTYNLVPVEVNGLIKTLNRYFNMEQAYYNITTIGGDEKPTLTLMKAKGSLPEEGGFARLITSRARLGLF